MAKEIKQIDFVWEGKDKSGNKTGGEISAISETIARTDIRKMGLRVLKIKKKQKPLFSKKTQPITPSDIAIFARQLATMLEAGVPLVQAFDIIGKGHKNPSMAEMLMSVKSDIEGGDTLAEALRRKNLYFDDLFCSLVEAGEQAGVLETYWTRLPLTRKSQNLSRKKLKRH